MFRPSRRRRRRWRSRTPSTPRWRRRGVTSTEARRRRREVLAFYEALPGRPVRRAARVYSSAKLALLDGDLATAERCYRAAADGFARCRPADDASMCLGIVADFDERAGDHRAAIAGIGEAVEHQRHARPARVQRRAARPARLGAAPRRRHRRRPSRRTSGPSTSPARSATGPVLFLALTGLAVVHRLDGRDETPPTRRVEALELHLAGGPRRLANRVDPHADVVTAAAACCTVLGCIAADAGRGEQAARAARARRTRLRTERGAEPAVPRRRRRSSDRGSYRRSSGSRRSRAAYRAWRTRSNSALTWTFQT